MAYKDFSYYYDYFNSKADYDSLFRFIDKTADDSSCKGKILCDLGRGTGELALRFCKAGYDVIAVEFSDEMLNILYEKKFRQKADNLLILKQDITMLDMYGTVDIFTCTYDTVNHLEGKSAVEKFFSRVSLFLDPDGIFVFDANTPYKHTKILGNNEFVIDASDASCTWKNSLCTDLSKTEISVSIFDKRQGEKFEEVFSEYFYNLEELEIMLKTRGLEVASVIDGETFDKLTEKSQRFLFTCRRSNCGRNNQSNL